MYSFVTVKWVVFDCWMLPMIMVSTWARSHTQNNVFNAYIQKKKRQCECLEQYCLFVSV